MAGYAWELLVLPNNGLEYCLNTITVFIALASGFCSCQVRLLPTTSSAFIMSPVYTCHAIFRFATFSFADNFCRLFIDWLFSCPLPAYHHVYAYQLASVAFIIHNALVTPHFLHGFGALVFH